MASVQMQVGGPVGCRVAQKCSRLTQKTTRPTTAAPEARRLRKRGPSPTKVVRGRRKHESTGASFLGHYPSREARNIFRLCGYEAFTESPSSIWAWRCWPGCSLPSSLFGNWRAAYPDREVRRGRTCRQFVGVNCNFSIWLCRSRAQVFSFRIARERVFESSVS